MHFRAMSRYVCRKISQPRTNSFRVPCTPVHTLMLDCKFARLTSRKIAKLLNSLPFYLARGFVISPPLKIFFPLADSEIALSAKLCRIIALLPCLGEFPVCTLEKSIGLQGVYGILDRTIDFLLSSAFIYCCCSCLANFEI